MREPIAHGQNCRQNFYVCCLERNFKHDNIFRQSHSAQLTGKGLLSPKMRFATKLSCVEKLGELAKLLTGFIELTRVT